MQSLRFEATLKDSSFKTLPTRSQTARILPSQPGVVLTVHPKEQPSNSSYQCSTSSLPCFLRTTKKEGNFTLGASPLLKIHSSNKIRFPNVILEGESTSEGKLPEDGTMRLLGLATHHICSLIFFPCNSTVLILKSIPKINKKNINKPLVFNYKKQFQALTHKQLFFCSTS